MLWDNTTRVVFTLTAAALGLVAVYLLPGRRQIEENMTGSFERTGKYAILVMAMLVTGVAGVLAWEVFRYKNPDMWVGLNMLVLALLGISLLAGNIWTLQRIRLAREHVEVVEAELIELSAEEGAQPGLLEPVPVAQPGSLPPALAQAPEAGHEPPKE